MLKVFSCKKPVRRISLNNELLLRQNIHYEYVQIFIEFNCKFFFL